MSFFTIPAGSSGVSINCGADGATVTNGGPATVYYRDELPVTAAVSDGSLASGASGTLSGTQYFYVPAGGALGGASLTVSLLQPTAESSGPYTEAWVEDFEEDFTTSSEEYVDVPGMTHTFTPPSDRAVEIRFEGGFFGETGDEFGLVLLARDDVPLRAIGVQAVGGAPVVTSIAVTAIDTPPAGEHTYKVQIRKVVGTGTVGLNADDEFPTARTLQVTILS